MFSTQDTASYWMYQQLGAFGTEGGRQGHSAFAAARSNRRVQGSCPAAGTQSKRRAIVQGFLEPTAQELEDGVKVPTRAHRAIAEMVRAGHVRVIVTTNFDRLMENALHDAGIEPTIVSSIDTLAGAQPITNSQCFIRG